ncbi:hypothetical protein U6G28_05470 [Actinomycetaceae bacterium MB13-C1-2]|nr:hypothetical protein U6G28_05470 [Actinomycetaceae bacterium MB13-C1-2]
MADKVVPQPPSFRRLIGQEADSVFERPRHLCLALQDWQLGWHTQARISLDRFFERSSVAGFLGSHSNQGSPVVILLPGAWERWEVLKTWATALIEVGFDTRLLPEFDMQVGTLQELGDRLSSYLDSNDLQDVLIVAHSKGGLVAKTVLVGNQGRRVRRIISCGTPYEGAPIAHLSPARLNMRSLVPWNKEIQDLAKNSAVNSKIVAIRAAWDQNVPSRLELPGARVVTVPVVGHNRLLTAPEAIQAIVKYALDATGEFGNGQGQNKG